MEFVPSDNLFSRIQEELSSYSNAGQLDVGKFYPEVRLFIQSLGIPCYDIEESLSTLTKHQIELPCNFYMLESAWLCDDNGSSYNGTFRSPVVIYRQQTTESVQLGEACTISPTQPIQATLGLIDVCHRETGLEKVTVTTRIEGNDSYSSTYNTPTLLRLKNNAKNKCVDKCPNLFAESPNEISIFKKGEALILHSSLEKPTIYMRYFVYPMDENGLPMIPDDEIIQNALYRKLIAYFFRMLWYNGDDPNIQQKIGDADNQAKIAMDECSFYTKLPSWNKMVQTAKRERKRFYSYEVLNYYRYNRLI